MYLDETEVLAEVVLAVLDLEGTRCETDRNFFIIYTGTCKRGDGERKWG
jgi:hypothetical protein